MITVGQIVYNLEDYHNTGGVLFTSEQDFKTALIQKVRNNENNQPEIYYVTEDGVVTEQKKIDIYGRNIIKYNQRQEGDPEGVKLPGVGYEKIFKLGIQAPPGTVFYLSTGLAPSSDSYKRIMMGRSGLYELDETVEITGLYFEQPCQYSIDEEATQQSIDAGIEIMKDAKNCFSTAVKAIGNGNFIKWLNGDENALAQDSAIAYETSIKVIIGAENWDDFVDIAKDIDLSVVETETTALNDEATNTIIISAGGADADNEEAEDPSDLESRGNFPIDAFLPGFSQYIEELTFDPTDITDDKGVLHDTEYWECYDILHDGYSDMYDEGFSIYQKGLNGVYVQGNPLEIKNLIIDYLFEGYSKPENSEGGTV